ncbi:MAG: HAD family hydrolase [Lachnospiraceae bacterium]|jgi:hydroxymethylpyrimidine pyrophosphatase-like HAD family hydrolase|nr:HAD family hydrolase [Lachnospiraceae bacterium]MCH4063522.1 HAD family hydrolase [Lachnospiraceae bacterium]MCH4104670.1 HAD family hydrolase [Lachnospiraceae bacterium]MCI1310051.1 HAD family hydrolase [Lachnospiraceae bacterium]MCI1358641.1 HAD family hydrolase [Lachnospiraceae bacterium]
MMQPDIKTDLAGTHQDEAIAGSQDSESEVGTRPAGRESYLAGIDLDGTLLNDRKCITERTRALIHEATELGCEVVPVTGRPFTGLPAEILHMKDIHYVITNDGTMIHRLKEDRGPFSDEPMNGQNQNLSSAGDQASSQQFSGMTGQNSNRSDAGGQTMGQQVSEMTGQNSAHADPAAGEDSGSFGNLCAGPEALLYQEPVQSHTLSRETCLAIWDAIGWDMQPAETANAGGRATLADGAVSRGQIAQTTSSDSTSSSGGLQGHATVCEIFSGGTGYETADSLDTLIRHVRSHYLADYYGKSRKPVDDIRLAANKLLSGPGINMISAQFTSSEDCDAAVQRLARIEGINAARLSIRDIEIYGAEAGKGNALLELASFLGIPHEHTIAVADGGNDLPMMDAAAYSVAMGNAREEVLSRANLIAADNNHDGAMEAVMSLLTPLTAHI